jgi:hypothetical protein
LRALVDVQNVIVLALGEGLAFLGVILTMLSVRMVEDAKRFRREALELKKACIDYKASGERAYNDARALLREWERRSGQIAPGLVREEPPAPLKN